MIAPILTSRPRKSRRVTPCRADDAFPAGRRRCRASSIANRHVDDWCAPWDCARTWSWRRNADSWRTVPCRIRKAGAASRCTRSCSSCRISSNCGGDRDAPGRPRCCPDDCCCGWPSVAMDSEDGDDAAASAEPALRSPLPTTTTTTSSPRRSRSSRRDANRRRSSRGRRRNLQKTQADGPRARLVLRAERARCPRGSRGGGGPRVYYCTLYNGAGHANKKRHSGSQALATTSMWRQGWDRG